MQYITLAQIITHNYAPASFACVAFPYIFVAIFSYIVNCVATYTFYICICMYEETET